MNVKILLFLLLMLFVVSIVTVLALRWPFDSVFLNAILQWATPVLLILSFIFCIGIAVRHNLRTSNHFPGFSGHLPTHIAIGMIGKWGVRW